MIVRAVERLELCEKLYALQICNVFSATVEGCARIHVALGNVHLAVEGLQVGSEVFIVEKRLGQQCFIVRAD